MVGSRADLAPGCQPEQLDATPPNAPDEVAVGTNHAVALVDGEYLWRGADELSDRDTPPVRKENESVSGHALPKVGQDRPLFVALLDRATELRERDHRHAQIAGQGLEPAGDLTDLLDAALHPALVAHQLKVVDDDQPEAAVELAVEAPSLGSHLEHPRVARVIDPQRCVGQALACGEDLRPAILGHPALAQLLATDPRLRGDEPLCQL